MTAVIFKLRLRPCIQGAQLSVRILQSQIKQKQIIIFWIIQTNVFTLEKRDQKTSLNYPQ